MSEKRWDGLGLFESCVREWVSNDFWVELHGDNSIFLGDHATPTERGCHFWTKCELDEFTSPRPKSSLGVLKQDFLKNAKKTKTTIFNWIKQKLNKTQNKTE